MDTLTNQPTAAEVAADLKKRVDALVVAANAWAKTAITSDEAAGKAEDFLKQLRENYKDIDEERKRFKAPHDKAGKDVQDLFVPLLGDLERSGNLVKPIKAAYLTMLETRQRALAAAAAAVARQAAEDAEFAAAKVEMGIGSPVQAIAAAEKAQETAQITAQAAVNAEVAKPQVRGAISGRASGFRTAWKATITDVVAALTHYQNHTKLRDVLQQLADADARAMKENCTIAGIKAVSEQVV